MENIKLFKADEGYISPSKIRWVRPVSDRDCFEICVKSIGCQGREHKDTWSVCKSVSRESYDTLVNKMNESS